MAIRAPEAQSLRPPLTAADSSLADLLPAWAADFRDDPKATVHFLFSGGATTATVKLAVWNQSASQHILDVDFTPLVLTGNASASFQPHGRRCTFFVTALGAGTTLKIEVSGGPPISLQGS